MKPRVGEDCEGRPLECRGSPPSSPTASGRAEGRVRQCVSVVVGWKLMETGKAERRHSARPWLTPARLPPAQLALKHRQGKNHKMRIIAFVGSPVEDHEKDVSPAARMGTGPEP